MLNPDKPEEGEPRPQREGETETGLNPGMQARAEGVGLVMRRPDWSPNTKPAHEATMYAKEQGRDGELHHAIAKGYWEQGTDFGKSEALREAAEQSGLDWGQLARLLESGHYRQRLMDEYAAAKEKGIGVTPTYMIDGELLVGDVSVEDLRAAIDKAGQS